MVNASVPSDLSEWADGPSLIALRGNDQGTNEYQLGTREYGWHQHLRAQIFCVESGLIHVRTAQGSWLLPPYRAGYMPAGTAHQIRVSGALSGWSLLLQPSICRRLPETPRVLGISEVLRALVQRAASWSPFHALSQEQTRIVAVILDELRLAPHESLHLPIPSDARVERIARAILHEPTIERSIDQWAQLGALSARSLRRLIQAETGLSFARWRQQAIVIHALERLASGEAVNSVADALGYASPSNFIAMFKRAFGQSPARYFQSHSQPPVNELNRE